jgi:transposase, IS30 family
VYYNIRNKGKTREVRKMSKKADFNNFRFEGIEKKDKKGKKRTEVYYCHPYCSAERGSNENQNRMIRRHIPKGTNFDRKTKKDIQKVEDWLNNYPRPMFDGRSSQELYEEEMRLII